MPLLRKSNQGSPAAPIIDRSTVSTVETRSSLPAGNNDDVITYKGFHTSITAIFTDPSSLRTDCCSISCCGILQSDYNRYLLHQKRPPTWKNRFTQFILIPLLFFALAGYAAVYIRNPVVNQVVSTSLLFITIFWIFGSFLYSTHKRAMLRKDILRAVKYGLNPDGEADDVKLDQTKGEMYCAHRLCGCYPIDIVSDHSVDASTTATSRTSDDLCATFSRGFSACCCGKFGWCQIQLFGACALAQEGRELESLIPKEKRRFDYVTFQPYIEYFNQIRTLRMEQNGKLWSHYAALSKLSRILLKTLLSTILLLVVISAIFSPQRFQWGNMLVFLATFLQAFGVLYFVHWYWNRFDISLDAVIKYFACGFAITTTMAILFELLISMFLELVALLFLLLLPLEVQNGQGYGEEYTGSYFDFSPFHTLASASSKEYKKAFNRKYPLIYGVFLFLTAYIVAAMVEEMCKYFGFKMVEHPDFMLEQELQKAAAYGVPDRDQEEDRFELGGGLEYLNVSPSLNSDYESFDSYEAIDDANPQAEPCITTATATAPSRPASNGATTNRHQTSQQPSSLTFTPIELAQAPRRSIHSLASSITIAMVSVALGFACCENLIYIFLYNGQSLSMEISVLISRSLFPVHPICAAIQSIGVCKQQLENDQSIGIGRIILPAVLLHGSYDFSIMLLNFLALLDANGNEDKESILYSIVALCFSTSFVLAGIFYYIKQSHQQNQRLEQIDRSRNFVGIYT
mmetsp:Transcript_15583/g.29395  ORF Transcript_15583/g.29395 Transcript_15583/m.29395 type:complete len:743 (-) Transcript_15583:35-2263(-)